MTTFDLQYSATSFTSALLNTGDQKVQLPLQSQLHETGSVPPGIMSPGAAPEADVINGVAGSYLVNTSEKSEHNSPAEEDDSLFAHENEDDPTKSSQNAPIQKRRRVTRACDECRRKKIKCDGKQPCTHCTVYSYGKSLCCFILCFH
jgi:hypothetical protein